MADTTGRLLEAALAYLAQGLSAIPLYARRADGRCSCATPGCEHPGKHPRLLSWKEFQTRRASSEEVERWWQRWPDAGIGLVCGPVSGGLAVLDIDDVQLARQTAQLIQEHVPDKPDLVQTPSGGLHIHLIEVESESRSGVLVAGIADLKAKGGFVVAPPSAGYVFLHRNRPHRVADARAWAIELLRKSGVVVAVDGDRKRAYETLKERSLGIGERDVTLTSLAGLLHNKHFPPQVIEAALHGVNGRFCQPPVSEEQIEKIAKSAGRNFTTSQPYRGCEAVKFAPVVLGEVGEPGTRVDVVEGLLPEGYPTLIYGEGGLAKSLMALLVSTCVAANKQVLGRNVRATGVLYLDWELDQDEMARRAYRIARGLGLERPPSNLWYERVENSFLKVLDRIKAYVEQQHIGLVVIDSIGLACADDPELARVVIPLFAKLRNLHTTTLVIDHQSKLQQGQDYNRKMPFGSVYKYNLGRSVIQVERVSGEPGLLDLRLHQVKFNFGRRSDDIGLRLTFDAQAVRVTLLDSTTTPPPQETFTAEDTLLRSLRNDGQATNQLLAQRTGIEKRTVENTMSRLHRAGRIQEEGKRGRAVIWGMPVVAAMWASAPYDEVSITELVTMNMTESCSDHNSHGRCG